MKRLFILGLLLTLAGCAKRIVMQPPGANLAWHPSTTPSVIEYYVYRNGTKVGSVPATTIGLNGTYFDSVPPGNYTWWVTSWDGILESVPSNQVQGTVP